MTFCRPVNSIAIFICSCIMLIASADEGDVQIEKSSVFPDQLIFKVPLDFGKNAVWWSPSINEPCPMQVDEAIRRVMKHFEDADNPHITHLALLNNNVRVYNKQGYEVYSKKFRGYLFWLIRAYDKRLVSLEWPVRNHRDFLVFFDGAILEVLPDGSTRKLPPIDEVSKTAPSAESTHRTEDATTEGAAYTPLAADCHLSLLSTARPIAGINV